MIEDYFTAYIIVILCIALIVMAAITANALNKIKEYEKRCKTFEKATDNYWKDHRKVEQEKYELWGTIDNLEKENQALKELVEKYKVPRETTYNKSYGIPEVVDYFTARYPGEEPK